MYVVYCTTLYVHWFNLILQFGIPIHCISLTTLKIFNNISPNDYLLDVIFPNVLTQIDLFFSILHHYHFAN